MWSAKLSVVLFLVGMDELMEVSFSPLAATGKPLSRCGKCHRFMKYIQVKRILNLTQCRQTVSQISDQEEVSTKTR